MTFSTERSVAPDGWSRARFCAGLALGLLCAQARADWETGATAGAFYDDNLTRAQNAVDKRAAGAAVANVSGSNFIPFIGSDGVTFTLYGRGVVILGCNIHDWMIGYIYVRNRRISRRPTPKARRC